MALGLHHKFKGSGLEASIPTTKSMLLGLQLMPLYQGPSPADTLRTVPAPAARILSAFSIPWDLVIPVRETGFLHALLSSYFYPNLREGALSPGVTPVGHGPLSSVKESRSHVP